MQGPSLNTLSGLFSTRIRIGGILLLSATALSSSFYLELAEGYSPCIYCYVLRYLTVGMLVLSTIGLLAKGFVHDISALLASLGLVGTGVSGYLILDEAFPSAAICTACSVVPIIFGVSLYYYSIGFMGIVLGISISLVRSE